MTYKESCHKCIRSWYFSWPTLKYTDHYTDLIHPAASLYLSYTNRYTDCVRAEEGSLYRRFYAVNRRLGRLLNDVVAGVAVETII